MVFSNVWASFSDPESPIVRLFDRHYTWRIIKLIDRPRAGPAAGSMRRVQGSRHADDGELQLHDQAWPVYTRFYR